MINSKKLDYHHQNAKKIKFTSENSVNKKTEFQFVYSQNINLIENNNRKNYIESICLLLKETKLNLYDIKILSQLVLNAVNKMSENGDYSELKNHFKNNLTKIIRNENCKQECIKLISNLLENSKLDMSDVKQLSGVIINTVKKLTGENDSNYNLIHSLETQLNSTPKNEISTKNGYEADISNENSSNNRTFNDEYYSINKNNLLTNYKSKISNISSLQSPPLNQEKASSSGVFTESINEHSDSDCSDMDIVTRIIEDSNDDSMSDSCSNSFPEHFYEDDLSSDANHLISNETLCNNTLSTYNYSDSISSSMNRSTSWLANYSTLCDCNSCFEKQLRKEMDYKSFSSFRTDGIDSESTSLQQSSFHCNEDHFCLLCVQQKKRAQTHRNSSLFK